MRRPPSYSDSFIIRSPSLHNTPTLEPLVFPEYRIEPEIIVLDPPLYHSGIIFILKGSLHIFFISSFETLFYFLYVSASENTGIKNTIDAYYQPLIQSCDSWSNMTKVLMLDIMKFGLNKSTIDQSGSHSNSSRSAYNSKLLYWSIGYSVICLFIISLMAFIIWCKKIHVKWQKLFLEHLAFVLVLALYEYFFYITIIYNYSTVSTSELNQYIIDGLYNCVT